MTTYVTNDQVDAAIQYVATRVAYDHAGTVPYTDVVGSAGFPAPPCLTSGEEDEAVTTFMRAFHERCRQRHLPPLDAVVVHESGPRSHRPGVVYFHANHLIDPFSGQGSLESVMRAEWHWEEEVREVREWGEHHGGAPSPGQAVPA